jgi:asparagine synthase (glutamine-hydrolysing)
VGLWSRDGSVPPEAVVGMADRLRHRGPDDEGFLAVDTGTGTRTALTGRDSRVEGQPARSFAGRADLFLGHRRLAILDLSAAGHQPMVRPGGDAWIVFNGEIYNYLALRRELSALGHAFSTDTDTEVLLAAWEAWGEECVDRLDGMWAFVVYDRRRNLLFGARDRFGVKPFYYIREEGRFAFASEIKALLGVPFYQVKLNEAAVFDYLVLGRLESEEEGFFRGIFELPPAHAFTLSLADGAFRKWRHYDLPFEGRWGRFDARVMAGHRDRIRERVVESVRLRLQSDVPVGSCLSGGLDSSSIVCIVSDLLGRERLSQVGERQKAFTACYDESTGIDESRWAKLVADRTKADWIRVFPRGDEMLRDLEDLVHTQDIPFGSTSIYAQYRVMQTAGASGVKVLLDGQGADELFAGYSYYYGNYFAEMIRNFDLPALVRETRGLGNSPTTFAQLWPSLRSAFGAAIPLPALRNLLYRIRRTPTQPGMSRRPPLLAHDFWSRNKERSAPVPAPTPLNGRLREQMAGGNLKTLLRYEDRNSMRFSIEARTPFADDRALIEDVFSIPSAYKIHDGWSKHLLRESMRGLLPEAVRLRRDKIGFGTPEYDWITTHRAELKRYLVPGLERFLDVPHLDRTWDELVLGQVRTGITWFWRYINFAIWWKVNGL